MTSNSVDKLEILKDVFGYDSFRPGQEAVVDCLLEGKHVLAVMPTGAGKSLCFQVPALVFDQLTIVVSPLVALMDDQVASLRVAGVAAAALHSGREHEENVEIWRQVEEGAIKLLYLAPERLMNAKMLRSLSRLPVSMFAIDEAHCISQWGPAFRPEYEGLAQLKELFPGVPIAAMTATADEATRSDIASKLFDNNNEQFMTGFDRKNIRLSVEMKSDWKRQLIAFLKAHIDESGIIYCLSRKKTEEVAAFLEGEGFPALAYHAGLSKEIRSANQERFLKEDHVIMAATIAFGMGIDKPDVRFVFHTDLPGSLEAYYQEIGRAGRDGRDAVAHMLYGLGDIRMRRQFIENEDSDEFRKRQEHKRLDALLGFCEAPRCRRTTLLAYFGEKIDACGNCDSCLTPQPLFEGTREGQMALSAVLRTGQRYGAAHIVDVLTGADTEKIREQFHHKLPTFGVGKEHPKVLWRSILRQLVAGSFLRLDVSGYGSLQLTENSRALLKGEADFQFRKDTVSTKKEKRSRPIRVDLSEHDQALLGKLKAVRLSLAQERGVPPYIIFSDRSLEDMAARRPGNSDQFADVHGVGDAKLRDFGIIFLEAISAVE
ncbi:MAG: DNA helicase RecQ [Stappiaceae bacterium]